MRGFCGKPLFENTGRERAKMAKKSAKNCALVKKQIFIHFTKVAVTFAHQRVWTWSIVIWKAHSSSKFMFTESNPRYSDMSSKNSHEGIIWANPDPKMKGSFWRAVSQRVWLRWPSPLEGSSITFKQCVILVEILFSKTRGEKEQKWWK